MYYAALHRKKQQLNPAICATRPRLSAQAAHVFGRRHARDGAELTGKVLLAGKAELFCDLAHGQRSAAQQELAFLDPDLCDIRPRRDTELRAEQAVQICRADVRLVGKRLQAELFPGPRGDELDKAVDDAALGVAGRGQGLRGVGGRLPDRAADRPAAASEGSPRSRMRSSPRRAPPASAGQARSAGPLS